MEPNKKRKAALLMWLVGMVTMFLADIVSDPTTRHAIGGIGILVALVGLFLRFKTRKATAQA